ncbi:MAG: hypothetical protein H7Z19_11055 [Chitinophagaceae bacterium]|nr:hypothetical protein [Rubrivivax sp.]
MNRTPPSNDLAAPATQIVADRDAYLGQGRHDVGRRIADDQVELFISGDVAQSLQREFEQHASEFIAVHDLGTSGSLRLLGSLASAAGARVQRLSIRRQGHGIALAVLQFIEVPLADGSVVRVYSTDLNADTQARQQLARVLLAWSRLGVLMVGELPAHTLTAALAPLHEAITRGPWPNRELLMVPLGSGTALAAQATQLTSGSAVQVHVTPRAAKPKQVWNFIGGTWNRLHGQPDGEHSLQTDIERAVPRPAVPQTEAATEPMPLDPLDMPRRPAHAAPQTLGSGFALKLPGAATFPPPAPSPAPLPPARATTPMPVPGAARWQDYAERCAGLKGVLSCCVFDTHSLQPLAHSGGAPSAERLAQQGAMLLAEMNDVVRALGLGTSLPEAAISTGSHHLILRHVPGHPGIALHLVLQASQTNLTLARMQLERVEPPA